MFPISHTYVATKTMDRTSDWLILGSVLPDIATTSANEISRDEIHYAPQKFYEFINNQYPELVDLAIGVRLHSQIDNGADYYSDNETVGFAKIEGRAISGKVAKLLGIEEGPISLVLAHNFIEAAVDLELQQGEPSLIRHYAHMVEKCDRNILSKTLADYLSTTEQAIHHEVDNFFDFLHPTKLSTVEGLIEGVFVPLVKLKFHMTPNPDEATTILTEAQQLVEGKAITYLNSAVKGMKKDFSQFVSQ